MIAVVLAGLLAAAPDSVDVPCPGGDVISRSDLEAAGAMHPLDALRLTTVLDGISVDGFDAEPIAALGVPFAQPVRVLVDGVPVARGAGPEPPGLDAVPLALAEVDRVVVCPGPAVAAGALGGPVVDVRTSPPAPRLHAAIGYGNETGDPGPLAYTVGGRNVDRWGPYAEGGLAAGATRAVARYRVFLPTDPDISGRTFPATVDARYPKRVGTVGALVTEAGGVRLRVGARRFADLPFVAASGGEVPLGHASVQGTASGQSRVGRLRVAGHVHAARLRLDRPDWSALALDPAWTETRLEGAVRAARAGIAGGVRAEHVRADAAGLDDGTASVGQAWARAARGRGAATLALAAAGSGLGGGATVEAAWALAPATDLRLSASAQRLLPEAARDLSFWRGRGYDALAPALPEAAPLDVARVRLDAVSRHGPLRLGVSAEGQVARGRPALSGVPVEAEGRAARVGAEATWQTRGLRVRARTWARGALSGTEGFRAAWRRLPRLGAVLDATVRPDDRLALWARLGACSEAQWGTRSEGDVPGAVVLDLGLSKRAWGDRLRLSLGGRNVLDAGERTHPLGADLAPRLFVRAEARL